MVRVGEAVKEVRDETEKQLHAICGMVEDIAKIASKNDLTLQSKVPLIDHFYQNVAALNQRIDKTEKAL